MTSPYRVEVRHSVDRTLSRLPATLRDRILRKLQRLASDPRPPGCAKLAGLDDTYRIRVSAYRVVYEVHDRTVLVIVLRVAHRREVYRA